MNGRRNNKSVNLNATERHLTIALVILLIALGGACINSAGAQNDPAIETFWTNFKTAVIKGDKEAIASIVQFPITMPYGVPAIKTKAQLLKRYRDLFNRQSDAAKCFAHAKPELETANKNKFSVACKDAAGNEVVIYGFVRTRGVWKLKSLDNVNE